MNEQTVLFDLLKEGVSPTHVVKSCEKRLKDAGFEKIAYEKEWNLKAGGRYYVDHHDTTLFAFTIPEDEMKKEEKPAVRIAAAHTDFPCLRIKPNPEMEMSGYQQLNVEVYGGAILNTWLDRPLGIAGKVALASDEVFAPRIVHFSSECPVAVIPNIAIHMNPALNKGVELNKQKDMIPIVGIAGEEMQKKDFFYEYLAKELQVSKEEILDFDLYLYNTEMPETVGMGKELISAPRLDNLTSVQALLDGIITGEREDGINLIALFDHEEIGSRTKQGAGSMLLRDVVEKIQISLGRDACQVKEALYQSMLLSVDVAHAMHPNQNQKADVTNQPVLNRGFCIKESGNQSYATDCEVVAIVEQICKKEGIAYQKYVNRSDIAGGSTLGAIAGSLMPVQTVDIGVPILAMHSARELMGVDDMSALSRFVGSYFSI